MSDKVYQRVAADLERRIIEGIYKPMSRLPPEREFALEFQISRTTVREALMALEVANVIEIKDRSGAYVLPTQVKNSESLAIIKSSPGPHEVLQLRRLIEGEASFLVAMNGSDENLAAIADACKANAEVPPDDTPDFHEASKAFHISIVKGCENSLFLEMLEFLWDQKRGPLWKNWYASTRSKKNRLVVLANNQEITDAILARRPQAARTAMQRHIDGVITRFLSY